jgi:filamentous hemagglutinin family protein
MNSYWYLSALIVMIPSVAVAQVVPDGTMGSQVVPNMRINNVLSDKIEAGQLRSNNLFHSFSEFNIGSGRGIYFTNPTNITNIFTRVTGANASNINGVLGVLGNANLFLMNPNGIVFGTGAKLDVKGSFIGTTASSINFSDSSVFSAKSASNNELLSVSVPVGLGFGSNPAAIQVSGTGHNLATTDINFRPYSQGTTGTGLQVQSGKTLALVGGDIKLDGGILSTAGGNIELGSVGAQSQVGLNATTQGFKFDYSLAPTQQNIQLSNKALINLSGTNTGSAQLQGNQISIREGANIWSQNRGNKAGGDINIRGALLEINGTTTDEKLRSGIISETLGLPTSPLGTSGNINISASGLTIQNGGAILSRTFTPAPSGSVTVNVTEFITLAGLSPKTNVFNMLGTLTLFGVALNDKPVLTAKAGDVNISTQRLSLKDASYLFAISFGDSPSGNIAINADTTELIGGVEKAAGLDVSLASSISSIAYRRGDSGNIKIDTRTLSVQDGAMISTSNIGTNNAGHVTINARESVDVAGVLLSNDNNNIIQTSNISSTIGSLSPTVQSFSTYRAFGNAGRVTINTPSLKINNSGRVSVSNFGNVGEAGNLTINVNSLQLNDESQISASSFSGKEGNITINTDNLEMRRQSKILTDSRGGNGGNINIGANTIIQLENSDITANAPQGRGGNININTQGIFNSADSQITATGAVNGEIQITTPNINQDNSLKEQSSAILNTERVIASSCLTSRNTQQTSFVTTGNGGLPQAPNNEIELAYGVIQIRPVQTSGQSIQNTQVNRNWKQGNQIQEATQLVKTSDGRLVLATINSKLLSTNDMVCENL